MKFKALIFCLCFFMPFLHAYNNDMSGHKCDLLKQECSLLGTRVSLKDKNLKAMQENVLLLRGEIIAPSIKIKGVQMDMGDMAISTKSLGNGEYEFKFIPAMCMMHQMSYEVFLYSGARLIGKVGEFSVSH